MAVLPPEHGLLCGVHPQPKAKDPMPQDDDAPKTLGEALLAFQERAPKITKDATASIATKGGGSFKFSYVTLAKLLDEVLPILTDLKLTWLALPSIGADGKPTLKYQLTHGPSDQSIKGEMSLMTSGGGPQDQGIAISYARRYALLAALNLAPDKDGDGQAAGAPARCAAVRKITKAKAEELWEAANRAGVLGKLQLAAVHVAGTDVGKCDTKGAALTALVKLSTVQAGKLAEWIDKKAAEALGVES